jgi:hypothetical protein
LAIDRLWVAASQGHFGFSVQKQIWQDCGSPMGPGKDWDRFCDERQVKGEYVTHPDLEYVTHSDLVRSLSLWGQKRELPFLRAGTEQLRGRVALFSRAATCEL